VHDIETRIELGYNAHRLSTELSRFVFETHPWEMARPDIIDLVHGFSLEHNIHATSVAAAQHDEIVNLPLRSTWIVPFCHIRVSRERATREMCPLNLPSTLGLVYHLRYVKSRLHHFRPITSVRT
jgi:hypothetical protein